MRAQNGRDRGRRDVAQRIVTAGERQLEGQLVQPVGAREVAQPAVADQRPERRLDRRAQTGDHGRAVADVDRPPRERLRDGPRELGVEIGRGEVRRLEDRVGERAERGPARPGGEQRGDGEQRRVARPALPAGRGSSSAGSSVTIGSSGSLATRASCVSAVMSL